MIYFLGISPGRYQAIIPTFVVDWDARAPREGVGSYAFVGERLDGVIGAGG